MPAAETGEFTYSYRKTFGWTLGFGAGLIAVMVVVAAIGGALVPMLIIAAGLVLLLVTFLGTNALDVDIHDGQLSLRTGLGRTHVAPVYDVRPRLRVSPASKVSATRQLTLRMPGQRHGITVPKSPAFATLRLIAVIRAVRPNAFDV